MDMCNKQLSTSEHTRAKGALSENLARDYLVGQGYTIVAMNVHMKIAEIDIIAKDQNTLCFVEVRSRKTDRFGLPEATVGAAKQFRIIKAASWYLQRHFVKPPRCRFDVISVLFKDNDTKLTHHKNAFGIENHTQRRGGPWQVY